MPFFDMACQSDFISLVHDTKIHASLTLIEWQSHSALLYYVGF